MNRKKFLLAALCISLLIVTGCAQKKDHIVTIKTKYGDMIAILYDETPKHKENFIKLAEKKYYDSLLFHRVIPGFMIQGGDPESKKAAKSERLGNGGPGYTLPAEFNPKLYHMKGALSAARLGDAVNPDKASSGSQFYIVQGQKHTAEQLKLDNQKYQRALQQFFEKPENKMYFDSVRSFMMKRDHAGFEAYLKALRPKVEEDLGITVDKEISPQMLEDYTTIGGTPNLDGEYTVFGRVIKGLDVIDKIAAVPGDIHNRPLEDIRMEVTVEELPRKKIEKLYGYTYPEN